MLWRLDGNLTFHAEWRFNRWSWQCRHRIKNAGITGAQARSDDVRDGLFGVGWLDLVSYQSYLGRLDVGRRAFLPVVLDHVFMTITGCCIIFACVLLLCCVAVSGCVCLCHGFRLSSDVCGVSYALVMPAWTDGVRVQARVAYGQALLRPASSSHWLAKATVRVELKSSWSRQYHVLAQNIPFTALLFRSAFHTKRNGNKWNWQH
jgi:hypothetical protein